MATFQIPQFINQKPKIIGSLSILQFSYLVFGSILSFIAYSIFTFTAWIVTTSIIAVVTLAFTFVSINGQPLTKMIIHVARYIWRPRTYTWQKISHDTEIDTGAINRLEKVRQNLEVKEKLKSLQSKILNAKGAPRPGNKGNFQVVTYLTGEQKVAKRMDYK